MNIKNLRCYGKILVLTLATSITLSSCKQVENKDNINFKQVRNKIENTKDDFSCCELTSIKIKYDENTKQYLLSGTISEIEVEAVSNSLDDISKLIENATNLESITIDSSHLEDIELLNEIPAKDKIKRISISSNYAFENIRFLTDFKNCESLFLSVDSVDYSAINSLKKLKSLGIYECIGDEFFLPALSLEDLEILYIFPEKEKEYNTDFINSIQNLKKLETFAARKVTFNSINFLKGKTNLSYLDLGNCNISDITVIRDLVNLEYLYLDNNFIIDATSLYDLPNLKYVQLNNNPLSKEMLENIIEKGISEMLYAPFDFQTKSLNKGKQ